MTISTQTTFVAAALLLAASSTVSTSASAQSRYFDKLEGQNMGEVKTEIDKRLKRFQSGSSSVSGDTINSNNTTIKIDRAGIRSLVDRYLPK